MVLSNYTSTLLLNRKIFPTEIAAPFMISAIVWIMLLASLLGIAVNSNVLYNFYKHQMSSFDIMCTSKTLSNMCILLGYVLHNAPITILNNFNGPTFINILVNQMVSYGIYIVGPIVQFMISINRAMVIIFVKQSMTQNNQKLTIILLVVTWIIGITLTVVTTIDPCSVIYNPEMLNWWSDGCDDFLGDTVTLFVISCVLSNICNAVIAVKLVLAIIQNKTQLDSSTVRRRKQKSRKLFIQSCIQDWLFAIDSINSTFVDLISNHAIFNFIVDIFSNLMTPVLDGFVMLIFNQDSEGNKSRILSVRKRETTSQNIGRNQIF